MLFSENKQHMDDLIVGYLKNELSKDQILQLTTWIRQHKDNKRYFDEYREVWITSAALGNMDKFISEKGFEKFLNNIEEDVPVFLLSREQWMKVAGIAAIFVVAFLLGGIIFSRFGINAPANTGDQYSEIIVPRGAKAHFVLMDGTLVTLNAGSKLRYNNRYGISDRVVELEGEGYFKVAKDKERPFIVNTSFLSVKALGTEFNVKAYMADKTIETTLVEGSVEIEKLDKESISEKVILQPNQKLTYYKSDESLISDNINENSGEESGTRQQAPKRIQPVHKLVKENVKVEPLVSWKENRWIIEKLDLSKLAVELERKFDIQILFRSERLKSFRFTGTLLDEPLEQVLKVMTITAPINYEMNGKKVTLSEKENFEQIYRKLYNDDKKY